MELFILTDDEKDPGKIIIPTCQHAATAALTGGCAGSGMTAHSDTPSSALWVYARPAGLGLKGVTYGAPELFHVCFC